MAGAAISPAIASIAGAFPNASTDVIKLIVTLPPLMVIPFALISGRLCDAKWNEIMEGLNHATQFPRMGCSIYGER